MILRNRHKENRDDKMQAKHNGNGFLLGVIVGIILTLLFTTKKGRKILHRITQEGLQYLAKIEGAKDKYKEPEQSDYIETSYKTENSLSQVDQTQAENIGQLDNTAAPVIVTSPSKDPLERITISGKRFFRGTSKKLRA